MKVTFEKNGVSGMTLVEVVVSVAILAVVAGGMISSFNYGFFSMQLARENQRATQVMLEKTETLRLYRWDQVNTPGFIPASFEDVYDPQAAVGAQGPVYHGTLTVTDFPFSGAGYCADMRQLTISLTWTNQMRSVVRTRTISTLIAKDGIQNYVY